MDSTNIYIYIYRESERERVTLGVTLNNITPPINLLLNSYFENLTIELYVFYIFNMHVNRIEFTIYP